MVRAKVAQSHTRIHLLTFSPLSLGFACCVLFTVAVVFRLFFNIVCCCCVLVAVVFWLSVCFFFSSFVRCCLLFVVVCSCLLLFVVIFCRYSVVFMSYCQAFIVDRGFELVRHIPAVACRLRREVRTASI